MIVSIMQSCDTEHASKAISVVFNKILTVAKIHQFILLLDSCLLQRIGHYPGRQDFREFGRERPSQTPRETSEGLRECNIGDRSTTIVTPGE